MKLIIVESPTKARTLTRFLGKGYTIEATLGHIRDLPKGELGVDVEKDFTPSYVTPRDKMKHVKHLKDLAGKADAIILATDPDREGEAIAWHVKDIIEKGKVKREKGKGNLLTRITFHEITKTAIEDALKHPGTIDQNLVWAQQARRILDRLVGYKLSPLLWNKLSRKWLSAGRVQSVVVRLIVERERERDSFLSEPFFTITADFSKNDMTKLEGIPLVSYNGKKYEEKKIFPLFDGTYTVTVSTIRTEETAEAIEKDCAAPFTVSKVDRKEMKRSPSAPFTTSTLQQDAGRRLYFSAKKTMQVAQKLYEEGLITYHRTDSVNLSEKFISEAREYISRIYGPAYVPKENRTFQTKSKVAQEAHEAIRPTNVSLSNLTNMSNLPNTVFNHDHVRLYDLIWRRATASQASDALFDSTTILIDSANGYLFQTQGSVVSFDGFLAIAGRTGDEVILPDVSVGDMLTLDGSHHEKHETAPPPRYSEAGLVKALEEKDIGRPSTYAPIISTILERQYVVKEEKRFKPTELGILVTDFLVAHFPDILSLPFTASMEDDLDNIANGKKVWGEVVGSFYGPFFKTLEHTYKTVEKVKMVQEDAGESCPSCGNPLVIRVGKFGKFIACSTFPACSYTRQLFEKLDVKCPKCSGDMLVKKSRRGKLFYGCGNYPKCDFAAWKKEDIK